MDVVREVLDDASGVGVGPVQVFEHRGRPVRRQFQEPEQPSPTAAPNGPNAAGSCATPGSAGAVPISASTGRRNRATRGSSRRAPAARAATAISATARPGLDPLGHRMAHETGDVNGAHSGLDQGRFADPRIAADHQHPTLAGHRPGQRVPQRGQLPSPPDQRWCCHPASLVPPRGRRPPDHRSTPVAVLSSTHLAVIANFREPPAGPVATRRVRPVGPAGIRPVQARDKAVSGPDRHRDPGLPAGLPPQGILRAPAGGVGAFPRVAGEDVAVSVDVSVQTKIARPLAVVAARRRSDQRSAVVRQHQVRGLADPTAGRGGFPGRVRRPVHGSTAAVAQTSSG